MSVDERGLTLAELLIASTLAFVVVMGITSIDVSRVRVEQDLRQRAAAGYSEEMRAALAATRFAKSFEEADRIVLYDSGFTGVCPNPSGPRKAKIQVRYVTCPTTPPDATCLNTASNYHWDEYRISGAACTSISPCTIEYLRDIPPTAPTPPCPAPIVLAGQITSLRFRFLDANTQAPPGGNPLPPCPAFDPANPDNNVVQYDLIWDNGPIGPGNPVNKTHLFTGQVTSRAIAYTNVNAVLTTGPLSYGDSGSGLAPVGSSNPPNLAGGGCP